LQDEAFETLGEKPLRFTTCGWKMDAEFSTDIYAGEKE
jgi:hypothetical protein